MSKMGRKASQNMGYLNGEIRPQQDLTLSVTNRGFHFGESIFTTLKTYKGRPLFWEDHKERLLLGAAFLFPQVSEKNIQESLLSIEQGIVLLGQYYQEIDVTLKIHLYINNQGRELCTENKELHELILSWPLGPQDEPAEIKIAMASFARSSMEIRPSYLKSVNYLENVIALREALAQGYADALFCTPQKTLAEGTRSNIFLVKDEKIYTPSLNIYILDGITRRHLIKCLLENHISVFEKDLTIQDLKEADEVFFTGSVRGIIPVLEIKLANEIITKKKGEVTRVAGEFFERYMERYVNEGFTG